jgi:transcriptional regulator with XRE-family HTH domain
MDDTEFGARLRELRELAGLTQQELADRAGLTLEGVGQLERGRRQPAWHTALALCDALGVSCEEIRKAPADQPPRHPGRPPKGAAAQGEQPAAKRPRGRPKKQGGQGGG